MTTHIKSLIFSTALGLLMVPKLTAASDPSPGSAPKGKGAAAAEVTPASTLKQGMSADAVLQIMGKPSEIKPMESPTGKVEVWIFTREVSNIIRQEGIPSPDIVITVLGSDGRVTEKRMPGPLQYQSVQYRLMEKCELLIFNTHYLTQKTSRYEERKY